MGLFKHPSTTGKPIPSIPAPRGHAEDLAATETGAALSSGFLGANLFTDDKLRQAAPTAYAALEEARLSGAPLKREHKDQIAKAMMEWAIKRGAVNFAHWFSPMRGANAQKHDGFMDLDYASPSVLKPMRKEFDGTKLFMAETDGSSFPNGGMRVTHTAAAFNSWDMKSPPFVRSETMYIPSCFVAWTGMALDEKTPLLRSMAAINEQGKRMLSNLGEKAVAEVRTFVGWEQEFFVISKAAYLARPDLMATTRTILGAAPVKSQQQDMLYFGQIPNSVARYLEALQKEFWLIGIPMTTYHNEVAPAQHEIAPIFSVSNVAVDQNMLCMELMQGILSSPGGGAINLMKTGSSEEAQIRFAVTCACLARGMKVHGDVVRNACIGAGNDHRLGAQEAPPAIMSLYPGIQVEAHLQAILEGGPLAGYGAEQIPLNYGCTNTQEIMVNAEDRNRTAPFPHCGNRFEFRAVGGPANMSHANTLINTVLADSFCEWSDLVEGGMSPRDATAEILKATCMIQMVNQAIIPACAHDLKTYEGTPFAGKRTDLYTSLPSVLEALEEAVAAVPHGEPSEVAHYCCDVLVPAMAEVRAVVDAIELLMEKGVYPFPSYTDIMYGHQ
ncbi:glutamine synthetase type III N terminal-domain-containing protein [Pavlovales sp. CCMP2436]|nr:glutamine synthetase type III N terminal-domain-containing protein [Pavlovales sp. CCMP2436]